MAEPVRVREIEGNEGQRLLRIIRRGTGSVVTWRRAQMVLLSAQVMPVARIGAVVTVCTQGFIAVILAAGLFGGLAVQQHEDKRNHPAPAPSFTGEVGCRSGGDNSECADTGG